MRSSGKREKSAADPARKIRDCSSVRHGKTSPKAAALFSAARIVLRNSLSWSFGCTDMRMILHIGFPERISLHLKKSLRPAPTNPLCKIQKTKFFPENLSSQPAFFMLYCFQTNRFAPSEQERTKSMARIWYIASAAEHPFPQRRARCSHRLGRLRRRERPGHQRLSGLLLPGKLVGNLRRHLGSKGLAPGRDLRPVF